MEDPVLVAPYRATAKWPIYEFNGRRFYWRGGYYKDDAGTYLHRAVWEAANGPTPIGFHVHHIDEDGRHNWLTNLECLSPEAHGALHMADADRAAASRRSIRNAIAAAAVWRVVNPERASEIARIGARTLFEKLAVKGKDRLSCSWCAKPYEGYAHLTQRGFCGPSCQGMARKASGVDDEDRCCVVCGAAFRTNKHGACVTCTRSCGGKLAASHRLQHRG